MKRLAPLAFALIVSASQAAIQEALPSPLFDSTQLLLDLKTLSADDMQGREVDTPGGAKARAYVIDRFKAVGLRPFGPSYEAPFTFTRGSGERHGVNVLGQLPGTAGFPKYIIVSAHYDHIGTQNGQVFNGADDNASGTAALFAIAKHFSELKPAHPIIFAAFDAEEVNLQGSRAFLAKSPVDPSLISIVLNADMIGREPNDRLYVVGAALQPFLKDPIKAIASTAPVKLLMGHEDPKKPEDWTQQSDHYTFIQAKIPALYFGVEDFEQHHKATDDFETISKDFYVRAVETLVEAVTYFDKHLDEIDKERRKIK